MSLFNINLSGVASDVLSGLVDYLVQPIECLIQDAINWILYGLLYLAKMVCDLFFSFLQVIVTYIIQFVNGLISVAVNVINSLVNTIRQKLPATLAVAVTPVAEERLLHSFANAITNSRNMKDMISKTLFSFLGMIGIPFLAYGIGLVLDEVFPKTQLDVTPLLAPYEFTTPSCSSGQGPFCCPIVNVVAPQCTPTCGSASVPIPVCSAPIMQLSTGAQYQIGVNFAQAPTTTTTTSTVTVPSTTITLGEVLNVQ